MKLVFTKSSPLNTVLVDKTNGQVVYEIETEKRFLSKTTVIRKPFTNRRGKPVPGTVAEVAKIQWKTFSSDRIVYYGCSMKRGEFMPKAGLFTQDYAITANGSKYRWSTGSSGKDLPKLVTNSRKKKVVAEMHRAHRVFGRRKAYLEVAPAGLTMLDQIVVSLVYVEKKRREKKIEVDDSWVDKGGDDGGGGDGGGGGGFDGGGGGGADGGGGGGADGGGGGGGS